jgi:hypothetical protein
MTRARRLTTDAMVGAGSLCTVIAGVSMIDPNLRAQMAGAFAGDSGVPLAAMAARALDAGHAVVRLTADYLPDSTPLLGFGIVAIVLTAMMIRA